MRRRSIFTIVIGVISIWLTTSAGAQGPERLVELSISYSQIGDYVPEQDGVLVGHSNKNVIVDLADGSEIAVLPVGNWQYSQGYLIYCSAGGGLEVRQASTLAVVQNVAGMPLLHSDDCTIVDGQLWFALHGDFHSSLGTLNLTTGELRTELLDISPVVLLSHSGQPGHLYVEEANGLLRVFDVSGATPIELGSTLPRKVVFNETGDRLYAISGNSIVTLKPSDLSVVREVTRIHSTSSTVLLAGDRFVGVGFNEETRISEVFVTDYLTGKADAVYSLPASAHGIAVRAAPFAALLNLHHPANWQSISGEAAIVKITPPEAEIDFPQLTTLELWTDSIPTALRIDGQVVSFERVDRGVQFTPPALPLGTYDIGIDFADGSSLVDHADHTLTVGLGPARADLSIVVEAAPGDTVATSRIIHVTCTGAQDPAKNIDDYPTVAPGDTLFYHPVVDSSCKVDRSSGGGSPLTTFGPVIDGRIIDVWIVEQPEFGVGPAGEQWGVVLNPSGNQVPLWVGVFQTTDEGTSREVELACPGRSEQVRVPFGGFHRFTNAVTGDCVLRAARAPYAVGTSISEVDLHTGIWSTEVDGEYNIVPLRNDIAYFVVRDVYYHPLDSVYQFVIQQYRDVLGRPPDHEGISYWGNQMARGEIPQSALVEFFIDSPEFGQAVAPVSRLYWAYFERMPDLQGIRYWTEQRRGGASLDYISGAFAASPEFEQTYGSTQNEQFVDLVYRNVLGRTPDEAGANYWVQQLEQGLGRGSMMIAFSESAENLQRTLATTQVTATYLSLLARTPEPAGFTYWVDAIENGLSLTGLIDAILDSQEYENRFDIPRITGAQFDLNGQSGLRADTNQPTTD